MSYPSEAAVVMERCDILGGISEEAGQLTRPFLTPAMRRAAEQVAAWMRSAGMSVQVDGTGMVRGRYESEPAVGPTLLLGSHIDTVRNAGKYDGPLGVIIAIACIQRLHDRQTRLPFTLEVFAFPDEEGLRFGAGACGAKVVAGVFKPEHLTRRDASGITLADALRAAGVDPETLPNQRWQGNRPLGYVEVHIEQGPVLEARGVPVGVVSAIAGQNHATIRFVGEAGHAGTVPMDLRQDALCAAGEFILAVEETGRQHAGLVATVGKIGAAPGVHNVIPGEVTVSLDIRHLDDALRNDAFNDLQERARRIGAKRGVTVEWLVPRIGQATPCTPHLVELFTQSVEQLGHPVVSLPSGAGHDAGPMARLTDMAMLFVRCKRGISHNPAESVTTEDVGVAIDVLSRFIALLSQDAIVQGAVSLPDSTGKKPTADRGVGGASKPGRLP